MNLAYKALTKDNLSPYQQFAWPMPMGKRPGKWVKVEGELSICRNGIHLCDTALDLLLWLDARIAVMEWRGESIRADKESKRVVTEARVLRVIDAWNEQSARLFAADCTERVLPVFEEKYTDDNRPRKAIEAARAFAFGEIDKTELHAAGAAAGDAAWDAAYAAWAAAYTTRAAAYAAGAAARDAARAAAWAAECEWQAARLAEVIGGLE